jgi:hypothetical protein
MFKRGKEEIRLKEKKTMEKIVAWLSSIDNGVCAYSFFFLKINKNKQDYIKCFLEVPALEENESFPLDYYVPLKALWEHENIQKALEKGNTLALHDNIP